MVPMFLIELTCGEEPCEITTEVVSDLEVVETLVCDECGHCLHVLSISEAEIVEARVPAFALPLAA